MASRRGGPRPGSGRPRKRAAEKRSEGLSVYLRPDEYRELLDAAEADGRSAASWARDALLRALRSRKVRKWLSRRSDGAS